MTLFRCTIIRTTQYDIYCNNEHKLMYSHLQTDSSTIKTKQNTEIKSILISSLGPTSNALICLNLASKVHQTKI